MELLNVARVPAVLVSPDMTVAEAVALMVANNVGSVVVANPDNQVLGIFTERDNLIRVTAQDRDPNETYLAEVMTAPVNTVPPDTTVEDALSQMIRNRYRHLPIVNDSEQCLGIVSLRYLLMRRISEKQASLDVLHAYVTAGGPG